MLTLRLALVAPEQHRLSYLKDFHFVDGSHLTALLREDQEGLAEDLQRPQEQTVLFFLEVAIADLFARFCITRMLLFSRRSPVLR